jgi:hypothetical protein
LRWNRPWHRVPPEYNAVLPASREFLGEARICPTEVQEEEGWSAIPLLHAWVYVDALDVPEEDWTATPHSRATRVRKWALAGELPTSLDLRTVVPAGVLAAQNCAEVPHSKEEVQQVCAQDPEEPVQEEAPERMTRGAAKGLP